MREQLEQILKEVRELRQGMDRIVETSKEITAGYRRIHSQMEAMNEGMDRMLENTGEMNKGMDDEFAGLKARLQKMATSFDGEFNQDFDRIERRFRSASESGRTMKPLGRFILEEMDKHD